MEGRVGEGDAGEKFSHAHCVRTQPFPEASAFLHRDDNGRGEGAETDNDYHSQNEPPNQGNECRRCGHLITHPTELYRFMQLL